MTRLTNWFGDHLWDWDVFWALYQKTCSTGELSPSDFDWLVGVSPYVPPKMTRHFDKMVDAMSRAQARATAAGTAGAPMTPQQLAQHELASRMAEIAWAFNGCTADDLLAVAGFLATSACRCFEPEVRLGVAEHWCSTLLTTVRESLD